MFPWSCAIRGAYVSGAKRSGTDNTPLTMAMTQKIHLQASLWDKKPPATGPIKIPIPHIAIAEPHSSCLKRSAMVPPPLVKTQHPAVPGKKRNKKSIAVSVTSAHATVNTTNSKLQMLYSHILLLGLSLSSLYLGSHADPFRGCGA